VRLDEQEGAEEDIWAQEEGRLRETGEKRMLKIFVIFHFSPYVIQAMKSHSKTRECVSVSVGRFDITSPLIRS